MKNIFKYILSVATIVGSTIGVGIFSLPYITTKVGFLIMLGYLVLLTGIVLLLNLLFAEISLRTPDFLRLPGFCHHYFGKIGKWIALIAMIIASFGTLLAYIVIGGEFLRNFLGPVFGDSSFIYAILYFAAGATFIFLGVKAISKIDFFGVLLFLGCLALIIWRGSGAINMGNVALGIKDFSNIFLPYGPLLFALWSGSMIPEVEEMLASDKQKIKKVITFGTIMPAVCYLVFIVLVVSISGVNTSHEAIAGLKNILGSGVANIMFLAGIITTFTCFITIGLNLEKILWYDMKIPKNVAWMITCFVPFFLYSAGVNSFISIIGFIGAVALAIEGVLILLMYSKIKRSRVSVLIYPLIAFFIAGLIYELIYFVR